MKQQSELPSVCETSEKQRHVTLTAEAAEGFTVRQRVESTKLPVAPVIHYTVQLLSVSSV